MNNMQIWTLKCSGNCRNCDYVTVTFIFTPLFYYILLCVHPPVMSNVFSTHHCLDKGDVIHWILHSFPFWPRDGSGGLLVGRWEPSVCLLAVAPEGLHHPHHHVSSDCSLRCEMRVTADCLHLFPKHLVLTFMCKKSPCKDRL